MSLMKLSSGWRMDEGIKRITLDSDGALTGSVAVVFNQSFDNIPKVMIRGPFGSEITSGESDGQDIYKGVGSGISQPISNTRFPQYATKHKHANERS